MDRSSQQALNVTPGRWSNLATEGLIGDVVGAFSDFGGSCRRAEYFDFSGLRIGAQRRSRRYSNRRPKPVACRTNQTGTIRGRSVPPHRPEFERLTPGTHRRHPVNQRALSGRSPILRSYGRRPSRDGNGVVRRFRSGRRSPSIAARDCEGVPCGRQRNVTDRVLAREHYQHPDERRLDCQDRPTVPYYRHMPRCRRRCHRASMKCAVRARGGVDRVAFGGDHSSSSVVSHRACSGGACVGQG